MIMKLERQRRRTGTIARLPREVRDQVNEMLDDGCPYDRIIEWLAAKGHPGVEDGEISEWKKGGFQDWLEFDARLKREEKVRELSYEIAMANEGSKTQEAAIQVAASFLFQVFMKFDPDELAKQLKIDPKHITAVLNAFSRINRRGSETEMIKEYKRQQEQQRLAASQEKVVSEVPAGLSDEGRAQIEQEYRIRSL